MSWFDHKIFTDEEKAIAAQIVAWDLGKASPPAVSKHVLEAMVKKLNKLYYEYNDLRAEEYDDKEIEILSLRINQLNRTIKKIEELMKYAR